MCNSLCYGVRDKSVKQHKTVWKRDYEPSEDAICDV
jgi:hypothetical protein